MGIDLVLGLPLRPELFLPAIGYAAGLWRVREKVGLYRAARAGVRTLRAEQGPHGSRRIFAFALPLLAAAVANNE